MSLWFIGVLRVSVETFRKQFATHSGWSEGAFAASNGGVPAELWSHRVDWNTLDAQKRCMKCDKTRLLSVSRAAMLFPTGLAPDVRTDCGSAVVPPLLVVDNKPPDVVGVPTRAFAWN